MKRLSTISSAQWALAGLIVALAIGQIFYNILIYQNLKQTAALFIGLPAIIAIAITLTPRAKSATGMILKGLTIAMMLSGILWQEGFICILMAAPIFYGVGVLVGLVIDWMRRNKEGSSRRIYGLLIIPLFLMSLEGVIPAFSFSRDEVVTVERVVPVSTTAVEKALSQTPTFDQPLPLFLRLGFPVPLAATGSGLNVGNQRFVYFTSSEGASAEVIFEVSDRKANSVEFQAVTDNSAIAQWLGWQRAEVSWVAQNDGQTLVTWTLHYQRRLDPAWYFGPLERFAVGLTAGYLIETLAIP